MAKSVNKTIYLRIDGSVVENNLKSIRAAINKTTNELNRMTVGSDEYIRHSKKLAELTQIYNDYRKELHLSNQEIEKGNDFWKRKLVLLGSAVSAYTAASAALQRFVSATQEYVEAYASLDDAMTSVSKYTGLSREEVKQLNEEFKKMDTRTPTLKLNALAADAGRLGNEKAHPYKRMGYRCAA